MWVSGDSEKYTESTISQPMFRAEAAYAAADTKFSLSAPTPVFSSEQDVSTSAHVVFLIGDNN